MPPPVSNHSHPPPPVPKYLRYVTDAVSRIRVMICIRQTLIIIIPPYHAPTRTWESGLLHYLRIHFILTVPSREGPGMDFVARENEARNLPIL